MIRIAGIGRKPDGLLLASDASEAEDFSGRLTLIVLAHEAV